MPLVFVIFRWKAARPEEDKNVNFYPGILYYPSDVISQNDSFYNIKLFGGTMKSRKNEIFHSKVKNQLQSDVNAAIADFKKMIATPEGAVFFIGMMKEWKRRSDAPEPEGEET